ncbi:MAG: nitrilase-related carbon-nitrogen hydrolase [Pseudomonadota bacterium]
MERYTALALQSRCDAVNRMDTAQARASMLATIARIDDEIAGSLVLTGPDTRLVVLPEYFMTAYPLGESIDGWAEKAAIAPDGPEYEAMGAIAQKYNIWLSGNAYETDTHFPGYYFQCSFVVGPDGDVILRYRRLISMFAPTPHDVWDRYLDIYGKDAIFPVVDTAIGRLACVASEEILFPEITRALANKGAEILLHSSSEVASPELTPKEIARRARAIENCMYVITANTAGVHGAGIPPMSVDGQSKIVDYKGKILASADSGQSMSANAGIDLAALRAYRQRPGMPNYFARQRLELFADTYSQSIYPANSLTESSKRGEVPAREHFIKMQRDTIQALKDSEKL